MRYFSSFTGAGGFDLAVPKDWKCVGHSEIDKHASMVLKYRFPDVKNYGDINAIKWDEVPDFDILFGGTPCQDLSLAGKRKGLAGERSGLFFKFVEALKAKKPEYFVWENVKGTFSTKTFIDFEDAINIISDEIIIGGLLWQKEFLPRKNWELFADNVRNYIQEILLIILTQQKNELGILSTTNLNLNSQNWKEEQFIKNILIQNSRYLLIQILQIIKKSNYCQTEQMEALEELEEEWDLSQNLYYSNASKYSKDTVLLEKTILTLESIGLLWKDNLVENSHQKKLFITSTSTNLIIDQKIYMFAKEVNINIFILKHIKSSNYLWKEIKLNLKKERGIFYVRAINTIIKEFSEAGYSLWWQVLNAKDFGVPQNRERIFIVGFRDRSPSEVFFERENESSFSIREERAKSKTKFYNSITSKEGRRKENNFILIPSATKNGFEVAEEGDGLSLVHIGSTTGRGRVGNKKAQALVRSGTAYTIQNQQIRRLMPIECERLMSWSDDWTKYGIHKTGKVIEISDSQRYKMIGNGVVSNVVEWIIKNIIMG